MSARRNHHIHARYLQISILLSLTAIFACRAECFGDDLKFETDVVPILKTRCFKCHGAEKQEGGLDLRRRYTIAAGGDSGPAIVAGKPKISLLLQVISDGDMPPENEAPLTDTEKQILQRWVATGALTAEKTERPLPELKRRAEFNERAVSHWAFQPIRQPSVPDLESSWIQSPIDAFILRRLNEKQWQPAEPATKRELIRRIHFDLIGLPPEPEDVTAFINDDSSNAYERVVDRLLASRHYGERWAQHWLDVVRYAETEGFEYDRHLPDAWRYRDYVIDSLNSDKPFDQFVREQIAGDELRPDDNEFQAAAIFHRLGAVRRNAGNPDIALSRNEVLTERTNIIGEAFLGLTVGCARCHNHKLEPITQKDYYRLQAYVAATAENDISLAPLEQQTSWKKEADSISAQIKKLKTGLTNAAGTEKLKAEEQIRQLTLSLPPTLPTIPGIRNDFENRTAIHVLRRGIWEQKGAEVGPRPPSVLVSVSEPELSPDIRQPRQHLARWLTRPDHPLTARVIVNRIWQQHFGVGIVKSANDFGTQGDPPSHPKLLDWLATHFVSGGWQLKPLHRMILLSNTYRQAVSNKTAADAPDVDPENRLLWRFSRRRLSGEEIRDAMLAVAGRLNMKMHGPSVITPVDQEMIALLYKPEQWKITKDVTEHDRRSVYLIAKRNLRLPFLEAFDAPTLQSSCASRESSTHAPQALVLLNGRFANDMATAFADRLRRECGDNSEMIARHAWKIALARSPSAKEERLAVRFIDSEPLREFALAIFNLSEFVYVR